MAVTLTIAKLRGAVRYGSSTEETAELTRILAYATEAVTRYAPDAPDVAHNEATIRLAGYILDQPNAARGAAFANAMRNSGAGRMLLPYVTHRAGTTAEVAEATAAPAAGVSEARVRELIAAHIRTAIEAVTADLSGGASTVLGEWSFANATGGAIDTFRDTGLVLPDGKTWLHISQGVFTVNVGAAGTFAWGPGAWHRVLITDLPAVTVDQTIWSDAGAGSSRVRTFAGVLLDEAVRGGNENLLVGKLANGNIAVNLDGNATQRYTGSIRFRVS